RLAYRVGIAPVPNFLADLFRMENAGVAQHAQVMRHRGARERGGGNDLTDIEALTRLEHQQHPLPVRVAQCDEHRCRLTPGTGDCASVAWSHPLYNTQKLVNEAHY